MKKKGYLISFEGGEGAGKTTQVNHLRKKLVDLGVDVLATREPGGSDGAELIRNLLVSGPVNLWDPLTEAMLHFAARRDHIEKLILPALKKGNWVLTDRFTDSTLAYQGFGLGLNFEQIKKLKSISIGEFQPDFTILLDTPVQDGLKRAQIRSNEESRYEKMKLIMHERVRDGFLAIAKQDPERVIVIDALSTENIIAEKIWEKVSQKYKLV